MSAIEDAYTTFGRTEDTAETMDRLDSASLRFEDISFSEMQELDTRDFGYNFD